MDPSPNSHEPAAHAEEEVRTPGWLTATGIGLFVLAGVGWLMTRPPQPTIEQMRQDSTQAAEAPAAAAKAPPPAVTGSAAPAGSPATGVRPRPLPVRLPRSPVEVQVP
jgi:hypothetical protein